MADPTPTPSADQAAEKTVPYSRFQEVVQARQTAEARVSELTTELEQSQAAAEGQATLAAQLEKLQGQLSTKDAEHGVSLALARVGLEGEGAELAQWFHGRLGDGAPPIAEWLQTVAEDRSQAPAALQAYLGSSDAAPAPAPAAPADPGLPAVPVAAPVGAAPTAPDHVQPGMPTASSGVLPRTATGAPFSADAIGRLSTEEYRAQRTAILAQLGRTGRSR